uniref:Uncharacterized protein n=1 Tax=Triticum urartu TaxID=4572 RepID=A0A8R7PI02_TRIUA
MMAMAVGQQNTIGVGIGLNMCLDSTNEQKPNIGEVGRSTTRAAVSVQVAHENEEPEDKPMILDRKGKAKAIEYPDAVPWSQWQKTMHELLGASFAHVAVVAAIQFEWRDGLQWSGSMGSWLQ